MSETALRRAAAYYRKLGIPEGDPVTVETWMALAAGRISQLEGRERMIRDALEDIAWTLRGCIRSPDETQLAYDDLKRLRERMGWLEPEDG